MKIRKTRQSGVRLYKLENSVGEPVTSFAIVTNEEGYKPSVWLFCGAGIPMPRIARKELAAVFRKIRKEAA
jgi:hypothetical protein